MSLIQFGTNMGDDEVGCVSLLACAKDRNHPWCVMGLIGLFFTGAYYGTQALGAKLGQHKVITK